MDASILDKEQIVPIIAEMYAAMSPFCGFITGLAIESKFHSAGVKAEIELMIASMQQICASYNNLRRQLAIDGVGNFYAGQTRTKACPSERCSLCKGYSINIAPS